MDQFEQIAQTLRQNASQLLSQDLIEKIKKLLDTVSYSDEQKEKWLDYFYTHWISGIISANIDLFDNLPVDDLKKAAESDKENGVKNFLKTYLVADTEPAKKFRQSVADEFEKTMLYFMKTTFARKDQKKNT
jgi:hypothetical protein